jgi:hypothetical protein
LNTAQGVRTLGLRLKKEFRAVPALRQKAAVSAQIARHDGFHNVFYRKIRAIDRDGI